MLGRYHLRQGGLWATSRWAREPTYGQPMELATSGQEEFWTVKDHGGNWQAREVDMCDDEVAHIARAYCERDGQRWRPRWRLAGWRSWEPWWTKGGDRRAREVSTGFGWRWRPVGRRSYKRWCTKVATGEPEKL